VGRHVVLTGGGAEINNIADYLLGVRGRGVRVARPRQLTGLPDAHSGPAFATLVGLALLAGSGTGDIRDFGLVARQIPAKGMIGRLIQAMKGGV
jgi:cell division protein FtsA